ncbi:hypothetical protein Bache_2379 [Bacteroides helcogenes P 36-108]|uniref:Uncharacterized protein n=1 Tax=Bacteroides helcogenes (strain ATCC 35417 / DSM 20613 / JCM 6297 / CCUG 15421 / P 36-108) TaxID=693979 RepID=E6SU74_BACT6|nr:hypothetical protein Bache_2379 [Bacteroides helcogenes P 36-108]
MTVVCYRIPLHDEILGSGIFYWDRMMADINADSTESHHFSVGHFILSMQYDCFYFALQKLDSFSASSVSKVYKDTFLFLCTLKESYILKVEAL